MNVAGIIGVMLDLGACPRDSSSQPTLEVRCGGLMI